jgi:hypothetical protein
MVVSFNNEYAESIAKIGSQGADCNESPGGTSYTCLMPELSIEGNGRLERTAIYYNGQQLDKVREIFIHISEDGDFDALIMYVGSDGQHYTKNLFADYLDSVLTEPAGFTHEEAASLQMLTLESDGTLELTQLFRNGEQQEGVVRLYVHIKAPTVEEGRGLRSWFGGSKNIPERVEFAAEITYRELDGSLTTEGVF